jgi:uncharacterized protein YbjT (DUF2867 family)
MDSIALVGASGILGMLVRDQLETRGRRVIAIERGDARDPAAIARAGAGTIIDCAGASVAIAPGHGWRGYRAVDTPIGLAVAEAARRTGAHMIYVAAHHAPAQRGTPYIAAHERVALAMRDISGCVVRATGFFAAFAALLQLARRGWLVDVGDGHTHTNPIDERDLAELIVDRALAADGPRELVAGGPDVLTRRELYELIAKRAGRRVRIVGVPVWLARIGSALATPLHPRIAQFGRFACGLAVDDVIAPSMGTRRFDTYLASVAAAA